MKFQIEHGFAKAEEVPGQTFMVKGIEFQPHEIPLYPLYSIEIEVGGKLRMTCTPRNYSINQGQRYLIRVIGHELIGKLELEPGESKEAVQATFTSWKPTEHLVRVPIFAPYGAHLDKLIPCAAPLIPAMQGKASMTHRGENHPRSRVNQE